MRKKRDGFSGGKVQFIAGICLFLYALLILPFCAGNAGAVRGDEIQAGKAFYPEKVYAIENLQLLRAKTDDDRIYCIAKFSDREQEEWTLLFTPGRDRTLAERIRSSGTGELDGYFLIGEPEDLPFEADAFYTTYADGPNRLSLHAEYLCKSDENFTLRALFRPGIPLASFVAGLFGMVFGGLSLIRNRPLTLYKMP